MKPLPLFLRAAIRRAGFLALFPLLATVFMLSCSASAQAGRTGLIAQAVDETQRIQLRGNVHPAATRAADRGIVPASMPAERMILLLKRSPEQERSLRAAIEAMHDSNSPSFHKWLTPQQFGANWGVADSDIATVTAWLQSHGFTVKAPYASRTAIEFSGTAGQIQEAFQTEIHSYMVNGELHHANATDPRIPAALAPVVAGVTAMNDFRPKSSARPGKLAIYNTETRKVRPALTESGSSGNFFLLGPSDAATIYNSPNKALNPAATGSTFDGSGAKIGIIGDSNISLAQDANYRKLFGLSAKAPIVIIDGDVDPGENPDALEAYLDVELAGGIAPGATVYLYTAADTALNHGLDLAILRSINDNIADVLNLSFTACEGSLGQVQNQFYAGLWEQAAAQGISVTVATGDAGSANCDNPNTQTQASGGLQINGLGSSAYNIAVGGTDFAALLGPDGSATDFTKYVSIASDPATLRTALGYIPEVAWNDSSSTYPPDTIAGNVPWADPFANIAGTGGGKSSCIFAHLNGSTLVCESGYPKPSWQNAPGVPSDSARDVPDVSLFSADGYDLAAWGICTDLQSDKQGNPVADCTPGSNGLPSNEFYIVGVGGTSAAAPAFAGVLALVRQSTGERQGQANYVLYNLARNTPAVFHDVAPGATASGGNNAVPCQAGSPNCVKNAAGYYYMSAYETTAGFDLATGLGSVDITALIKNWAGAGLAPSTTHLDINPTTFEHGTQVTAVANVTSTVGIPAGQVAITAEANPPSLPLTQGIGVYGLDSAGSTGDIQINSLPGGSYKVIASYSGSETAAGSVSAPVQLNVSAEASSTIVGSTQYNPVTGASSSGPTLNYGFYIGYSAQPYGHHSSIVNGVIEPDGIPTGKVTFKANNAALDTDPVGYDGIAESINHNLTPGAYTISAAYSGDNSFKPSTGTRNVTIVKGETQISLKASASKYTGKPIVFTIALTTLSIADAPTGTVVLRAGTTTLAQGTLIGVGPNGSALASGTATISTTNLPNTNSEIVAVYLGDKNYASSTSNSVPFSGRPTFSLASTAVTLPSEHSTAAATIVVSSLNGYAGTIDFSCALIAKPGSGTAPICSMNPASASITAGGRTEPVVLIYGKGSKLPTNSTSSTNHPLVFGLGAGTAALACCLLFGVPARRRGWKALLSAILLLATLGSLSACVSQPKFISSGSYTFKVTGVDSTDSTNTASATVQVTVK